MRQLSLIYSGHEAANILEGSISDSPLMVVDKDIVAISISDVYLDSQEYVLYTDCEVYMPAVFSNEIVHIFRDVKSVAKVISEPVISFLHSWGNNYYHSIVEAATRVLLSLEHYERNGLLTTACPLLPSKTSAPLLWEMLDLLGVEFKKTPLIYTPGEARYLFKELHIINWLQQSDDPDQNDLWSDFVPPRTGIARLRDRVRRHQLSGSTNNSTASFAIVYAARDPSLSRSVVNDDLIIDAITKLVGRDHFYVFDGPRSQNLFTGIQGQIDLFSKAKIVIGPHGAGLTNMLWSADGTSIIEFPLKPHVDRSFGFLAELCGHDYWLVPQMESGYFAKYEATTDSVAALVRVLKQVIKNRGLQYLLKTHDEF